MIERRRRATRIFVRLVIVGAVLLLILALTGPFLLSALLNLIPDRYIAAYAPVPIREAAFAVNPYELVPTTSSEQTSSEALLELLVPTPTSFLPMPSNGASQGAYVQPTPIPVEPTPTMTPAYVPSVAERAEEGGEGADLAHASHLLTGFIHTYQGWNNCGPATITTALSYWGSGATQAEAAGFIKPNPEDRNTRPDELAAYAESLGYIATVRVGGNIELLKTFILAGYPVVIERGFDPEPDRLGWMGHYVVLIGFSDEDQEFIAMDSYLGPNRALPYDEMDQFWRHFNRVYIVIHRPDQHLAVSSIIGESMDDLTMYTNALRTAQAELMLDSNDPFGWFNLGSSLVGLGHYEDAAVAFDRARDIGLPWRILWYQFGPYETYLHVGRYDDVITLATVVLSQNEYSEEAYYYRGVAYQAQGRYDEAEREFNMALHYNSHYTTAAEAIEVLRTMTDSAQ